MKSLERIQQNSWEINRMLAQINALVQTRDASPTQRAALSYLDRRVCREFRTMCKAMARIGRAQFWSQVAERAQSAVESDAACTRRATLLLAYGSNVHAGAVAYQRFRQLC